MKLKTSHTLGGITFGLLLILGAQVTASAQQNSNAQVDELRMRDLAEQKRRSYEVSSLLSTVHYGLGVPRSEKELSKYQGIASKLRTTPEKLVKEFNYKSNPYPFKENMFPLTFKKFLLAKVIASNLEAAHPDITSDILLRGLIKQRESYAWTMRNLGLSPEEAKIVEKKAKQEIEDIKH